MSKSTRSAPTGVRLNLIADEKVFFEGEEAEKLVGQHARNANSEYVFVLWQTLLDTHQTFAMDDEVFEQVDETVRYVYVIDKKTKDLYKFTYDAYADAKTTTHRGSEQKIPPRWEFVEFWESCADNCLRGIYD